ncbi:MAG: hypothetical protein E3J72_04755 [Planctomycetota bacterium]|nr:MAG: hypothetical protein E3J72_04755 [Planctomycetota bacterium]
MRLNLLHRLLLAAVICVSLPAPAHAAQGRVRHAKGVTLTEFIVGLNPLNVHRPGWMPVCISYTVTGESIDGTIRLELYRGDRGEKRGLFTATRKVRFTAGQTIRTWFYVYADPKDKQLRCTITAGENIIRPRPARFYIRSADDAGIGSRYSGGAYRILLLADEKDRKRTLLGSFFRQSTRQGYNEYEFQVINPWRESHFNYNPACLPDRVEGYSDIDMIFWNGYDIDSLSQKQLRALEMWVRKGGTFFISPDGLGKLRTSNFIRNLIKFETALDKKKHAKQVKELPIFMKERRGRYYGRENISDPGKLQKVSRDRDEEKEFKKDPKKKNFTVYTPPIRDASPAGSWLDKDLVRMVHYGNGKVLFLRWDISRRPNDGRTGQLLQVVRTLLAETIIPKPRHSEYRDEGDGMRSKESYCTMLDSPAARLPHLALIGGLVIFYIVIVGPINYALLRRMDKRIFIPVTIPLIVVGYCIVITAAGYFTKGFTSLRRKVTVVRLPNMRSPKFATVKTYFSIFSSGETSFAPGISPKGVGFRIFKTDKAVQDTPVVMEQDATGWRYQNVRLINWSSAYFTAGAMLDVGEVRGDKKKTGRITRSTEDDDRGIARTMIIRNGTRFSFSGAIIRLSGSEFILLRRLLPAYSEININLKIARANAKSKPIDAIKEYFDNRNDKYESDALSRLKIAEDSDSREFFGFLEHDPLSISSEGVISEKDFRILVTNLPDVSGEWEEQ